MCNSLICLRSSWIYGDVRVDLDITYFLSELNRMLNSKRHGPRNWFLKTLDVDLSHTLIWETQLYTKLKRSGQHTEPKLNMCFMREQCRDCTLIKKISTEKGASTRNHLHQNLQMYCINNKGNTILVYLITYTYYSFPNPDIFCHHIIPTSCQTIFTFIHIECPLKIFSAQSCVSQRRCRVK